MQERVIMAYEGNNEAALRSIANRQFTKSMQTLIGICTGMTSDNHLNDKEIHFLSTWLNEYPETTAVWPGSIIADRVKKILSDGIISIEERENLLNTLSHLIGNYFSETGAAKNEITSIDYSVDTEINFKSKKFCFTGEFILATRSACKLIIEKLGGKSTDHVSIKLDYLVIGTLLSEDWIYTSHGRKIEKAMQIRQESLKPAIISEQQWTNAMKSYIASENANAGIIDPDIQNIYQYLP